jgi:hypothetical protein
MTITKGARQSSDSITSAFQALLCHPAGREIASFLAMTSKNRIRHCEPPLSKVTERVTITKGARQSPDMHYIRVSGLALSSGRQGYRFASSR